tara:strand:+ start:860 stop:1015 length:156 start_codon:yes stop_codon:yes gene_type:complete
MRWTIKEILIGIVEMVALLGMFVAIYFFTIMLCALSDKCAAYYGMIPGGSI